MKVGFRSPSFKKRVAARTSWKRMARHSLGLKAPRGWGWLTNPKKAAYNRVYSRTTMDPFKLLLGGGRGRSKTSGCLPIIAILFILGLVVEYPWLLVIAAAVGALMAAIRIACSNQSGSSKAIVNGELELISELESLPGVGPKMAQVFREAGYATVADLKDASDDDLLAIKGVGPGTLEKIRLAISEL